MESKGLGSGAGAPSAGKGSGEVSRLLPLRYSEPYEEFGAIWSGKHEIARTIAHHLDLADQRAVSRFIVRACNSHEALVAALKGLLEGVHGDGYCLPAGAPATQRAREALSKAEAR